VVVLLQALAHWPLLLLGLQRRFAWDRTLVVGRRALCILLPTPPPRLIG
jgi:hypothetical protein